MTTTKQAEYAVIERIREIQNDRGTTNKHLYTAAGISKDTWRDRMSGKYSFTLRELLAVADALGVPFTALTQSHVDSLERAA